jgi:hypothetical protein
MDDNLLDRVRKLLAKAEDEGCSPAEAEALTAKAAELMARYGIDRALLGALHPETDKPADRVFSLDNPWGDVKRHLLVGLALALRCQCVQTRSPAGTLADISLTISSLTSARSGTLIRSQLPRARAVRARARPGTVGSAPIGPNPANNGQSRISGHCPVPPAIMPPAGPDARPAVTMLVLPCRCPPAVRRARRSAVWRAVHVVNTAPTTVPNRPSRPATNAVTTSAGVRQSGPGSEDARLAGKR